MAAENKYTNAIQEIRNGIKAIISDMDAADKKILQVANNASKIGNSFKVNTPDGLNNILKEQTYLLKLLSEQIDKQRANTEKLNTAKKQLVTLTGQEKVNNKQLAKNADLYAQSTSKLVGAYQNLVAKQKMAKKTLQDLISAEKQNTNEIKKAQKEYDRLTARVNQANRATSNFSKNSLGGMVSGFKNLVSSFGLILGAQGFAQLINSLLKTTKTIQSLDFTLRSITKTQDNFVRVQGFLNDITEKFGLNLVSVTERYTKFLAAANQSGLVMADTEKIFASVSKASSVLGLRTDELTGVYLALEQMLSKGKVTTEELRRQLGERLPGAFGIMADAIGVSVSELDKMLKKGEVFSSEALPKFAAQLEKAYGIENVNRVDTLVAATQRLENSWTNFVKNLESSEGRISKVFITLFEGLSNVVDLLGDLNTTDKDAFTKLSEGIRKSALTEQLKDMEVQAIKTGLSLEEVAKLNVAEMNYNFNAASSSVALLKSELSEAEKELARLSKGRGRETATTRDLKEEIKELKQLIEEESKQLAVKKGRLDAVNQVLQKSTAIIEENTEAEKGALTAVEGSIGYLKEQISKLEELREKTATTSNAYHGYTMAIETLNEKLLELQTTFDLMSTRGGKVELAIDAEGIGNGFDSFDDIFKKIRDNIQETQDTPDGADIFGFSDMLENTKNAADEAAEYLKNKNIAQYWADTAEFQRIDEAVKEVFSTFSELYDLDMSKFEFLYDNKKNTMADYADAAKEVIGSVLDASLQRYEIELQEAQRSRDLIVNNELSTEKEKRLAREKFEEEERRIRTERAKQERKNNLIKIAVDTSVAVVKALASAPPPANFVLAGIVGALGVAQAAIVASQPLPKFAEGTKSPLKEDTLAIVGDGGRKEAITENGKLVGVTPDKPTLMRLKKGQEVQKDAKHWIDNAVYKMNMEANGQILSSFSVDSILYEEIKKLNADNKKTWEEVKKLASRPLNVKNKVIIEEKFSGYKQ